MAQPLNFSNPYRTDLSTPGSIFGTSGNDQMPGVSQAPAAPFVWGQGGARLTPEQLALRQEQATQLQQSDYSPVSSPWQGLARASGQWLGAFQQKGLDKESAAQAADSKASIAALLGGGGTQTSAVAAALSGTDPAAQKLAMEIYKRQNPAPVNNDTVADFNFLSQQLGPDAARQYLQSKADPIVNIPQPGGGVYMGPRSGMTSAVGQATPQTKKLSNGQTAYFVNGDWYDNPEGR